MLARRHSWLITLVAILVAACSSPAERAAAYIKSAQALYDKGDYKKAGIEARNAVQIEPKNAQALYLIALAAEKEQNPRDMFGALSMAVNADPKMVKARVKLGTLYFAGKAYDQAAEQAKAAAALAPDDPEVRVLNARVLLQKQDLDGAFKEIDAALAKQPDLAAAIVLKAGAMAETAPDRALQVLEEALPRVKPDDRKGLQITRLLILNQQKRVPDIEKAYQELVREYPKDTQIQYSFAGFYAGQGRVDDAEKVLRAVVAADPTDPQPRLALVQFLAEVKSLEAAQATLEQFVKEQPDQAVLGIALARSYEVSKRPDDALKIYQAIAEKTPKTKEGLAARARVAAIQLTKGQLDAGRAGVESILVDAPDNPDALLLRSGLRVNDKKYDDAIADIRTIIRKEPTNKVAALLLARTYALKGDKVLARDAYKQLLALDPNNPDAPRELAQIEAASGNLAEAEDILRKRVERNSRDIDARARVVDLMIAQKDFAGAEAEARQLSSLGDDRGVGGLELARALALQKKYPQAVDEYKRLLDANPEQPRALEGLVAVWLQMDRADDALAYLKNFVGKNPTNLTGRFLLGLVHQRKGQTTEAATVFERIVADKPEAVIGWQALASLYPKEPARRIEIYQRAVAAAPKSQELALLLGGEYEQNRRWDDAIAYYEKVLKESPQMDLVVNNLASLLLDRRTDKASYQRALELAKRFDKAVNPALLDTLGWAYYRTGDVKSAVPYLERAVAGARDAPLLHYHLGMAYVADKNTVGARQELTKATQDVKSDYFGIEEARATLARLGGGQAK